MVVIETLRLDIDSRSAKRGADEFSRSTDKAGRSAKRAGASMVSMARNVGALAAAFGGLAVIRKSVTDFGAFSRGMAEVSTLIDDTTGSMEMMRRGVLELAKAQGANEAIVARGLYQAISLGVEQGAEAMLFMERAQKAATAGVADTDSTVRLLLGTMNAYGIDVDKAEEVSDKFFTTVRLGGTTFTEMAASMSRVTPLAVSLGVSLEEVLAAVSAITSTGTPTAEAMTQIQAAMAGILGHAEDIDEVFRQRLGRSFSIADVRSMGLVRTLELVREATGGNAAEMKRLIESVEGYNLSASLTGELNQKFKDDFAAITTEAGSTNAAFEKIQSDSAKKLDDALNKIRITFVELIGTPVVGWLADVADAANYVASAFRDARTAIRSVLPEPSAGAALSNDQIREMIRISNLPAPAPGDAGFMGPVQGQGFMPLSAIGASLSDFSGAPSDMQRQAKGAEMFRSALSEVPGYLTDAQASAAQMAEAFRRAGDGALDVRRNVAQGRATLQGLVDDTAFQGSLIGLSPQAANIAATSRYIGQAGSAAGLSETETQGFVDAYQAAQKEADSLQNLQDATERYADVSRDAIGSMVAGTLTLKEGLRQFVADIAQTAFIDPAINELSGRAGAGIAELLQGGGADAATAAATGAAEGQAHAVAVALPLNTHVTSLATILQSHAAAVAAAVAGQQTQGLLTTAATVGTQALGGAFGNGILRQPTYFQNGGKPFVAGEAGMEAIMPLKELPGGQLGIRAEIPTQQGQTQTVNINNTWKIQTHDVGGFQKSRRQRERDERRSFGRATRGLN